MLKLDSLKSDVARENEGDWIDVPDLPGVALKVRSTNYQPYTAGLADSVRKLSQKYGLQPIPAEEDAVETGRLYAQHLLLDWRGFDVPYSREVALAALTDPAHRELRRHVGWAAQRMTRVEVEYVERVAGN